MDNDLLFDLNLQSIFRREVACDYDTVTDIAYNLIGLSELVKSKARECKKSENVDMMFFIANSLVNFSDKLYDSEFSCYIKKEPTPITDQVQE